MNGRCFHVSLNMDILTKSLLLILHFSTCTSLVPHLTKEEISSLTHQSKCDSSFDSCTDVPKTCMCDRNCAFYGDCCFDSRYRQQMNPTRTVQCVEGVYVISKCLKDWNDEMLRYYCEKYVNVTEPLSTSPVVSLTSGISYRNHYCATCNRDNHRLQLWSIKVKCNSSTLKDMNLTDLQYSKDHFSWGVWYKNPKKQQEFVPCQFGSIPDFKNNSVRSCFSTIDKCPSKWQDKLIKDKCESYQGMIYAGELLLPYRNVHCAICNRVDLKDSDCPFLWIRASGFGIESANFGKLFKLAMQHAGSKCSEGQVPNPIDGGCQDLYCFPFQEMRDGKCVNKS